MSEDSKLLVLTRLKELREALSQEPISDVVTKARHQCDRLEQGLAQSHIEGVRFASHTLLRLLDARGFTQGERFAQVRVDLQTALELGGYPH